MAGSGGVGGSSVTGRSKQRITVHPIWRCPNCRSNLRESGWALECVGCGRSFPTVSGIPDFRLSIPRYLDGAADLALAKELAESSLPLEELVRTVYSRRPGWDPARIELRTQGVLSARQRLHDDLGGWLKPITRGETFLDLGCGGGMLMAASADLQPGLTVMGVDASMTQLIVAQRHVRERGGDPVLAAAMAEALPFANESVPAIVSLDVIEHVDDPDIYLAEINRVLQPGGRLALSTPNRLSLTAEPHVQVWGVGWLPQSLQAAWVRKRSGKVYEDTVLMSSFVLSGRLRRMTQLQFRILIPQVPPAHIEQFAAGKRLFARVFNAISQTSVLRPLFLLIAPFFQVVGWKRR